MFKVTEGGKKYEVQMRGNMRYTIRSEKQLRAKIEEAIHNYETNPNPAWQAYGKALRTKGLWDVCSLFGIITSKRVI